DDVPLHGLGGSCRSNSERIKRRDCKQTSYLRFCAFDGRSDRNQVLAVWRQRDRTYVTLECGDPAAAGPLSKRGHVRALHNNDEARMTSDERMTKSGTRSVSSTIFRHFFVIRHSSFVICLLPFVAGIATAFAEK